MPLPFACPHCGLETLVDDEFAGHTGPCAACGKQVSVPVRLVAPHAGGAVSPARRAKPGTLAAIIVVSILAASVVFSILLILIFPSLKFVQDTFHRTQCRANLQRIAEALRQYEIEHGSLPPAFLADASGKPMHSWRVLILPQLGEGGLYAQYNFNEPWNGPNNSSLAKSMPQVYACPADPDALTKGESNYMVVVGPKTLFPGPTPMRTADNRDDSTTTILVTETPVAGVIWMEPKDLNATRIQFNVNSGMNGEIGSYHKGIAHAAMQDGSVRALGELLPTDYMQGMTTANGNENIPWDLFEN